MEITKSKYSQQEEEYKDQDTENPHRKPTGKLFQEVTSAELMLLYMYIHENNYIVQKSM